jgi:NAD(P)-dependent dehydrogenase (short-subunit alcohol dehydrogenase family)
MPELEGKIAVITGGSTGIGLAAAKRFAAEGAFVFITGRRKAELDKAVKEIGKNVIAVRSDVSKLEDLDRLYKEVAEKKGKIDILFANAGIVETVETSAVTPEHFDRTPIYSTYAATKAALRSYVRTWTAEFGKRGIRANIISPGPIETPMIDRQFPTKEGADALREQFKAHIPLNRIGLPEEVASAALFLASNESSYITGIDLPVDGGLVSV